MAKKPQSKTAPGFEFKDDQLVGPLEVDFTPMQKREGNRSWLVGVCDVGDDRTRIAIESEDGFDLIGPAIDAKAEELGIRLLITGVLSHDSEGDGMRFVVIEAPGI